MIPILEAVQITKDYPEGGRTLSVLRDVSLTLDRGEVVALVGSSGSGKTTLLFILGCLLTPTAGRVRIEGEEVNPPRYDRLPEVRRRTIGFVFQQFHLFPALTAQENIEYALRLKGHPRPAARREAAHLIEVVGLWERRQARPRDLSGGEQQRVAIARALAGSAPIILADEPTSSLDSEVGRQILELLRSLAKRDNRALLIVTHDAKVHPIADRVLQIRDGCLVATR